MCRLRLDVSGVVQGVGFRPFVCRLAGQLGLSGEVHNSGNGVHIEIEGPPEHLQLFSRRLREAPPPRAQIDHLAEAEIPVLKQRDFRARPSARGASRARVPPDLAVCDDCLEDIADPDNRRYKYPFTNCANCGPRYSIIERMPYDRASTAMRAFKMCPACAREYRTPGDRRFLAEPIACPTCGPRLSLRDRSGVEVSEDAIEAAARMLGEGAIVAVKGVGGFHLFVDAGDEAAVRRLREKKKRLTKPFAVMARLADAHVLARIDPVEADLLASPAAPIVLLRRRKNAPLAPGVAPECSDIGIVLPYTPLHHMLLAQAERPLVATSANRSGEPIVVDETQVPDDFEGLADAVMTHNRPILHAIDDSVCRVIDGAPQVLRLGRGYAPGELRLRESPGEEGAVLALGGHLKSAPVLALGARAVLGPHVGDLGSLAMAAAHNNCVAGLETLYDAKPAIVACDLHPDYETTRLADDARKPVVRVQHHLAHVASVIAEHDLEGPVLGFAWDGTGYGADGTIWGGETLLVDGGDWSRIARLRPFALPGGDLAAREPRRAALGVLESAGEAITPIAGAFTNDELTLLRKAMRAGVNAPMSSSAGRLFDACAALLGLCFASGHEGAAAMALEACGAGAAPNDRAFPFSMKETEPTGLHEIDWRPMIRAVVRERAASIPPGEIARAVHNTFAEMIARIAELAAQDVVALSGGCFQNRLLTEVAGKRLRAQGRRVFLNRAAPPGDGGLALGQAYWARRQIQEND